LLVAAAEAEAAAAAPSADTDLPQYTYSQLLFRIVDFCANNHFIRLKNIVMR
jgi:hypothetical protein